MKKRIVSLLLAALMVTTAFSLLPLAAGAEDVDFEVVFDTSAESPSWTVTQGLGLTAGDFVYSDTGSSFFGEALKLGGWEGTGIVELGFTVGAGWVLTSLGVSGEIRCCDDDAPARYCWTLDGQTLDVSDAASGTGTGADPAVFDGEGLPELSLGAGTHTLALAGVGDLSVGGGAASGWGNASAMISTMTFSGTLSTAYGITAAPAAGGSVTVSPAQAAAGQTVTLTLTPEGANVPSLPRVAYVDGTAQFVPVVRDPQNPTRYTFVMPAHDVTVTAGFGPTHAHDGADFAPWTETDRLPTEAGNWYLTSDVTLTDTWSVPAGSDEADAFTCLCLCGHAVRMAEGTKAGVIEVPSFASLCLSDCTPTEHDFTPDPQTGLWIPLAGKTEGCHTLSGGIVTGGRADAGAGVFVSGGTFTLAGGHIVGNVADSNGGGVNVSGGTFVMTGGSVCGNVAANGGGIHASSLAVTVLCGGTVTANVATAGGGVYVKEEKCLAAGTPITLADGTRRPIEELQIGDEVRVFDHETGTVTTAPLFDVWKYPEPHAGVLTLHFSHGIDVTVVWGHSFFDRAQNRYVSVSRDNVASFVGHEFYNADDARWETLTGYDLADGAVDTYVITSEKYLNCLTCGMLSNEDGFYTLLTNVFEYGEDLCIDADKKAADIARWGLWSAEGLKYSSRETYDALDLQYLSVAFGKGMITPEAFALLEAYWVGVDTDLFCETEEDPARKTAGRKTADGRETGEHRAAQLPTPIYAPLGEPEPLTVPTAEGIYVGGWIRIVGNRAGTSDSNLYLTAGKTVAVGTGGTGNGVLRPAAGMSVGVTVAEGLGPFATTGGADVSEWFFSDSAAFGVVYDDGGTPDDPKDDSLKTAPAVIVPTLTNGAVTAPATANAGEIVTLTVTPAAGYLLTTGSLSVTYVDGETQTCPVTQDPADPAKFTFVMPATGVTVCASFEAVLHVHAGTIRREGQAPTATEDGWTDYYECDCGALFADAEAATPIPDLDAWKAEGGAGFLARTGTEEPDPSAQRDLTWLWILLAVFFVADGVCAFFYVRRKKRS